jgi:hypothetical protein
MSTFFFVLAVLAMIATLATLATGVTGMARGGEFNRRWGNKLMQLRVLCQGAALLFFALALYLR